jgi:uncharacterized membrane protein
MIKVELDTNHNLLVVCLFVLGILAIFYYIIDDRKQVLEYFWISGVLLWYGVLVVAIILVLKRKRNGCLIAGLVSWGTLGFCLLDNWYTAFHGNIIAPSPNLSMTVRNFVTAAVSVLAILGAHNAFHKIST